MLKIFTKTKNKTNIRLWLKRTFLLGRSNFVKLNYEPSIIVETL